MVTHHSREENKRNESHHGLPFFSSWKGIYLAVLVAFIVMVILMYWFTRYFS